MTRISDKALRKLLQAATVDAGNDAPWVTGDTLRGDPDLGDEVWSTNGRNCVVLVDGRGERFAVARFFALAPDLATEVLALRREARRLKRMQISSEAEALRCGIEALSSCADVNRDGQRLLSDLLDAVDARDSLKWVEANNHAKQVVISIVRGEIGVEIVKREKGGR